MKVSFPCKSHDFEKNGNVWCNDMMNNKEFGCIHKAKCMGIVEDAIYSCLSRQSMHVVKRQEPIQEELAKEFELQPQKEFSEAV